MGRSAFVDTSLEDHSESAYRFTNTSKSASHMQTSIDLKPFAPTNSNCDAGTAPDDNATSSPSIVIVRGFRIVGFPPAPNAGDVLVRSISDNCGVLQLRCRIMDMWNINGEMIVASTRYL